jgi:hypothetical protein
VVGVLPCCARSCVAFERADSNNRLSAGRRSQQPLGATSTQPKPRHHNKRFSNSPWPRSLPRTYDDELEDVAERAVRHSPSRLVLPSSAQFALAQRDPNFESSGDRPLAVDRLRQYRGGDTQCVARAGMGWHGGACCRGVDTRTLTSIEPGHPEPWCCACARLLIAT